MAKCFEIIELTYVELINMYFRNQLLCFLYLSRIILNINQNYIFISQQKCSKWDSVSFFPNKESSKLGPSFPPFILLDKTFTEMVRAG